MESLKELPAKKGVDIRKALIQFHADHCTASLFPLHLLASASIDH
jgi:hypothetical protein